MTYTDIKSNGGMDLRNTTDFTGQVPTSASSGSQTLDVPTPDPVNPSASDGLEVVAWLVLFDGAEKLLEFKKGNYLHGAKVEHVPLVTLTSDGLEVVAWLVLFDGAEKLLEFKKGNYLHGAKVEHVPLVTLTSAHAAVRNQRIVADSYRARCDTMQSVLRQAREALLEWGYAYTDKAEDMGSCAIAAIDEVLE